MITIYTKPGCSHCVAAKSYLMQNHINYHEVDIMQDVEALTFLREQGHRTVPQVYVGQRLLEGGDMGLRQLSPDRLRQLSA